MKCTKNGIASLFLFTTIGLTLHCQVGLKPEVTEDPESGGGTSGGGDSSEGGKTPGGGGTPGTGGGGACAHKATCQEQGRVCGEWDDGCGGNLSCGACTGDLACDNGKCVPASSLTHVRVNNPFDGASFYLNPEYANNVNASLAKAPANLKTAIERVKSLPTAVWLDRIATIEGTSERRGIEGHLNEALKQQGQSSDPNKPMLVTFVVYDLPNRDCAAFASNGELALEKNGLGRYKSEYIDAIVAKLQKNPAYSKLRVVAIVEPDSIPNSVTNLGVYQKCRDSEAGYKDGVAYAVSKLAEVKNVYTYLDIAHSGWLGWEHTPKAAQIFTEVAAKFGGLDKIRGFATNVANYSAWQEPYNPYSDVNKNQSVIQSFYEWNRVIDETTFVQELRKSFPNKGFIVDTSRNGWKPTADNSPIEKRTHRGNWCNLTGAGIGERPRANPAPGVDAFFYIKPPGESDGTSDKSATAANEEGKLFDKMCGTDAVDRPYAAGKLIPTDATAGSPHAGHWFHEGFLSLVANATPPLK